MYQIAFVKHLIDKKQINRLNSHVIWKINIVDLKNSVVENFPKASLLGCAIGNILKPL